MTSISTPHPKRPARPAASPSSHASDGLPTYPPGRTPGRAWLLCLVMGLTALLLLVYAGGLRQPVPVPGETLSARP